MKHRQGSVLIILLIGTAGFMLFLQTGILLLADIVAREHEQSVADSIVLSTLRLRAKALEAIAARWESEIGAVLGPVANDTVFSSRSARAMLEKSAQGLANALPGYQSRLTAVRTVLKGAYGISNDIEIRENAGARLGLSARPMVLRDENGDAELLSKGWYARTWVVDRNDQPSEKFAVSYQGVTSSGRLRWDVEANNTAVLANGNGGFPMDWAMAVWHGELKPHRYPYFRAELGGEP